MSSALPPQRIEQRIFFLRGQNVMLSPHLAKLYQVEHRALNQAVKRNIERFPEDFMFQLTWDEVEPLTLQRYFSARHPKRSFRAEPRGAEESLFSGAGGKRDAPTGPA